MIEAFSQKRKPPDLNGQAQSDSDDAENDFDMDKNENDESSDDEVEYDGSEFPIVRKSRDTMEGTKTWSSRYSFEAHPPDNV